MPLTTLQVSEFYNYALRKNASAETIKMMRAMLEQSLNPTQSNIYKYISQHPGCTSREIADRFNIDPHQVTNETIVMRSVGLVQAEKAKGRRGITFLWSKTL